MLKYTLPFAALGLSLMITSTSLAKGNQFDFSNAEWNEVTCDDQYLSVQVVDEYLEFHAVEDLHSYAEKTAECGLESVSVYHPKDHNKTVRKLHSEHVAEIIAMHTQGDAKSVPIKHYKVKKTADDHLVVKFTVASNSSM